MRVRADNATASDQAWPAGRRSARGRADALATRLLDLAVAVPLCLLLAPVFLIVTLAVKLDSPGPALFRQRRRGNGMRPFTMLKFRSLRHGAPDPHERYEMLERDPRITRIGAVLRRTSLDELPQLLNVVEGSMSLVGPRPLVEWESQAAFESHPERFDVKPGITGLSQITVRNSVGFHERLDVDVAYARSRSIVSDLLLLARTPLALLRKHGIYPGEAGR